MREKQKYFMVLEVEDCVGFTKSNILEFDSRDDMILAYESIKKSDSVSSIHIACVDVTVSSVDYSIHSKGQIDNDKALEIIKDFV